MIARSPLSPADLYHTGFVVDDLGAAQQEVGRLFGVTWLEGGGSVRMVTPDGPSVVTTKYAMSAEGPHHVELVESLPGTLYTASTSLRPHHLGYWVLDVEAASTTLSASGLPCAASVSIEGSDRGPIAAYHQAGDDFYVEIVARWMRRVLFPAAQR